MPNKNYFFIVSSPAETLENRKLHLLYRTQNWKIFPFFYFSVKTSDSKVVLPYIKKVVYYIYTVYVLTCFLIWEVWGNVVRSGCLNLKDRGLFMFGYKRDLLFTLKVNYLNIDIFEWRFFIKIQKDL